MNIRSLGTYYNDILFLINKSEYFLIHTCTYYTSRIKQISKQPNSGNCGKSSLWDQT